MKINQKSYFTTFIYLLYVTELLGLWFIIDTSAGFLPCRCPPPSSLEKYFLDEDGGLWHFFLYFMLDAVVVKAQLPKTKLTGNSMVTRIQGSVLEKSGSLKEMLAKVPGMTQKG